MATTFTENEVCLELRKSFQELQGKAVDELLRLAKEACSSVPDLKQFVYKNGWGDFYNTIGVKVYNYWGTIELIEFMEEWEDLLQLNSLTILYTHEENRMFVGEAGTPVKVGTYDNFGAWMDNHSN